MRNFKVLPQLLTAIAANGGLFIFGISLGWSAPAGPSILSTSHKFVMTENEFAWAVATMAIGGALSSSSSGLIRNKVGTTVSVLLTALPNLLGWLLLIFAWNPSMIILGRLLVGIAGGGYCYFIPVYIGEFSSKEIRGILLTLCQFFVKAGVVFVYTLGSFTTLFTMNVICGSVLILYTIGFMFLPESPMFLVRNGENEKAEKSIRMLRGEQYDAKLEVAYLQQLQDEALKAPKTSFIKEIQKRATYKAFMIVMCVLFFFHMSGINAVIFYTTTIFTEAGVTMDPSIATIILGAVQAAATLSTVAFVDRFGRVFLLKVSFSMMILALIGIGTLFTVKASGTVSLEYISWLPVPSLCLFCVGFSAGLGSIPFVLLGEFFSDEAKKVIAPLAQTTHNMMSFGIGLFYPAFVNNIGSGPTFFMFAAFCCFGLLFTILVIPETKGKTLAEIQTLLNKQNVQITVMARK